MGQSAVLPRASILKEIPGEGVVDGELSGGSEGAGSLQPNDAPQVRREALVANLHEENCKLAFLGLNEPCSHLYNRCYLGLTKHLDVSRIGVSRLFVLYQ